jgi:hypothetical protein
MRSQFWVVCNRIVIRMHLAGFPKLDISLSLR